MQKFKKSRKKPLENSVLYQYVLFLMWVIFCLLHFSLIAIIISILASLLILGIAFTVYAYYKKKWLCKRKYAILIILFLFTYEW